MVELLQYPRDTVCRGLFYSQISQNKKCFSIVQIYIFSIILFYFEILQVAFLFQEKFVFVRFEILFEILQMFDLKFFKEIIILSPQKPIGSQQVLNNQIWVIFRDGMQLRYFGEIRFWIFIAATGILMTIIVLGNELRCR